MKRILSVDDEPSILDGLRRMLRSQRKEWDMLFANSGAEALELADASPVDAVISDINMPNMDGSEFLIRFQAEHPETVRFILSGHAERESVMRTVQEDH